MSPFALTGARVFDGAALREGMAVVIDGGAISAVVAERELPASTDRRRVEGLLAPGFIDIQVNGGGGVLFNDMPSVEGIAAIARAHRAFGVTGFLPTVITDSRVVMVAALDAVRAAIAARVPGVLGIHVEGPFISPAKPGVHRSDFVRRIEPADVALLAVPVGGKTLVTLAPEEVPVATVAALAAAGVILSAGHTVASAEEIAAARAAGLTGFTHLYNAMPPLAAREPGPVGAALDDAEAWVSLIVDFEHVSATALRVALAARGWQRMMLISDAMPTVGLTSPRTFALLGRRVRFAEGRLTTEEGTLAGAHLDMATAVRNAVTALGLPIEAALHMACGAPAAFLGLGDRYGRIAPGFAADLVLLDDRLAVRETWIAGVSSAEARA